MNGCSGTNSPNLSGKNLDKNHAATYRKNLDGEKEGCRKSFSGVEQGENGYCAAQSVEAEGGTQSGVKDFAKCGTQNSVSYGTQNGTQSGVNDDCAGEGFGGSAQIGDYASASSIKYCVNSLATDAANFSEKFDASSASQYDANDVETANCNVNLSSKYGVSSNFDANRGASLGASCEEKEILNLGENFNASYGENLHSNANFIYDSRKNSTANSIENSVFDPARRVFVYLDPPFAIRQGFGGIYERVLALITRLGSAQCELLIAIEHMSELELPLKIGDFALLKSRKFGATTMSYYAK
ncbi:RsmD family RNA methyltransferase [uncultured Campylobacter sp.]|uniref:RsmD family RNA methyltransferase n=1 Tax=uncultured Campylobacter sp. TaxID=218934 RepID=UPI00345C8F68